jgi:hypothetical protein
MFAANQNLRPLLPNPSVEFHIEKRRAKWRDQKRRQRQRRRMAALEAVGVTVLVPDRKPTVKP